MPEIVAGLHFVAFVTLMRHRLVTVSRLAGRGPAAASIISVRRPDDHIIDA